MYGSLLGGTPYGGAGLLVVPPPPQPPLGPPGHMERVSVASLHAQPGNQLERTGSQSLHRQTQ
jgi:hypothetical protein